MPFVKLLNNQGYTTDQNYNDYDFFGYNQVANIFNMNIWSLTAKLLMVCENSKIKQFAFVAFSGDLGLMFEVQT